MANKRVAVYCRVSTQEQAQGTSLEMQVHLCTEYAKNLGYIPPEAMIYTDISTGADMLRPGLLALLQNLPNLGHVVVYKLDRLTRSLSDWCKLFDQVRGVRADGNYTVISTAEAFDLTEPSGRAMAAMIVVFAELERETIQMRTTDALAKKRGASYEPALPLIATLFRAGTSYRGIASAVGRALGKSVAHTTIKYLVDKYDLGESGKESH